MVLEPFCWGAEIGVLSCPVTCHLECWCREGELNPHEG